MWYKVNFIVKYCLFWLIIFLSLDIVDKRGEIQDYFNTLPNNSEVEELHFQNTLALAQEELEEKKQIHCMAEAVLYEAYSESRKGKAMVAQTILNRSKAYRKSPCWVVNEKRNGYWQFSYHYDFKKRDKYGKKDWRMAENIAEEVLDKNHVTSVMFYKRCDTENSGFDGLILHSVIGNHCFYKEDRKA